MIPVSRGSYFQCHVSGCVMGMFLNRAGERMKHNENRESFAALEGDKDFSAVICVFSPINSFFQEVISNSVMLG